MQKTAISLAVVVLVVASTFNLHAGNLAGSRPLSPRGIRSIL